MKQKPLNKQVLVLTGASSGIGLVTARMAAARGAKLVLAARSEETLRALEEELRAAGGEAFSVVADVAKEKDVERIAQEAKEKFGGFDTWINNAGVSVYGRLEEVTISDHRQLFETNFWGTVYGSRIAVAHLKNRGGTLINIGSVLSDRAVPLQGMYSASKHAVKGFTDALRMELEKEDAPVFVSLIKPAAIDTPYIEHAKNYLAEAPRNPPPVYAPELVAEAILHCAQVPKRDLVVGGGGKMISELGQHAAGLTDKVMDASMFDLQKRGEPEHDHGSRGLYQASGGGRERGGYVAHVRETSLYTQAQLHPLATALVVAGLGVAVAALLEGRART